MEFHKNVNQLKRSRAFSGKTNISISPLYNPRHVLSHSPLFNHTVIVLSVKHRDHYPSHRELSLDPDHNISAVFPQ